MRTLFLVVLILSLANNVFAQNKISQVEEFKKRIQQNFDKYSSTINKKYSDYLRGVWERYNVYAPFTIPDENIVPVIYEEKDTITTKEIVVEQDEQVHLLNTEQQEQDNPLPNITDVEKDKTEIPKKKKTLSISFYNTAIQIYWEDIELVLNSNSNQSIGDAWDNLSEADRLRHTISDCLSIKERYNLCDWAYFGLIHQIAETIYSKTDKAVLLFAYILEQSGYDVKLGRIHNELYLLFSSEHEIYNSYYCLVDNIKYYPYAGSANLSEIEICDTPRKSRNSVSLYIEKEQTFNTDQSVVRYISFGNSPTISVPVNESLLSFYSSYPTSRINGNDMTRWAMYAQTPLNETTREELYKQLTSLVAGKNELEAANILLNFVQTGFTYKYDDEVWGEDRAFFAEESFAYPYCDCEDRSILFSHIIRDLLELEVALVFSPGHLFTAVKFSEDVGGAYLTINNEKFIVCEPTCTTGAPVGWSAVGEDCEGINLILLSKINYGKSYNIALNTSKYKRSLFPICKNGKYGYKNIDGEIVVPCEYEELIDSKQGDKFLYGAINHNKLSLFDYGGWEVLRNAEGYIPLELNHLKDGMKGDFFAIIKLEGEWYYVNLVFGPLETDFCFSEYYMEDVSYENNIYCEPQSEEKEITDKFIILKKKSNNKYGVLNLNSMTCIIPFEYDNISFVDNDKSRIKVHSSNNNGHTEILLKLTTP